MTIHEASERYNIPLKILEEYASWGLCGEVKKVMGSWQYDDSDIERLGTIMTLHDIGFTNEEVEKYMRLLVAGESTEAERMEMLNSKRNGTLDEIHFKERQLDRLDYLRFEMKRAKKQILKSKSLTVSIADEAMLKKADHVGWIRDNETDKSEVFSYHTVETGTQIIEESPVIMGCKADNIYNTDSFESFICKIAAVHAEKNILNKNGKIDYTKLKPALFEMPTYQYLRTGDVIGNCMKLDK